MITITTDTTRIADEAWDYPISELDYLLEEHDDREFVLKDGRLYEAGDGTRVLQALEEALKVAEDEAQEGVLGRRSAVDTLQAQLTCDDLKRVIKYFKEKIYFEEA